MLGRCGLGVAAHMHGMDATELLITLGQDVPAGTYLWEGRAGQLTLWRVTPDEPDDMAYSDAVGLLGHVPAAGPATEHRHDGSRLSPVPGCLRSRCLPRPAMVRCG